MSPSLFKRIKAYVQPAGFLLLAIYNHTITAITTPSLLLDIAKLRRKAYSRLWLNYGASYALDLPGNTAELLKQTRGTVLEIGAGSGELLHVYDTQLIQKIYGVEPAEDLHVPLEEKAVAEGFAGGKYVVLKCGAEAESLVPALARRGLDVGGLEGGIFDTIVCVRVLCMVPNIEETVSIYYKWLKPGGKLVVCEHGVNLWRCSGGSFVARVLQWAYMGLGWRLWMGECHLDRDMQDVFKSAGKGSNGWANVKLDVINPWSILPYTVGCLEK